MTLLRWEESGELASGKSSKPESMILKAVKAQGRLDATSSALVIRAVATSQKVGFWIKQLES